MTPVLGVDMNIFHATCLLSGRIINFLGILIVRIPSIRLALSVISTLQYELLQVIIPLQSLAKTYFCSSLRSYNARINSSQLLVRIK